MESVIPYSSIQDVNVIARWGRWGKYCLRITVNDGSVLLQVNNAMHSLHVDLINAEYASCA